LTKTAQQQKDRLKKLQGGRKNLVDLYEDTDFETALCFARIALEVDHKSVGLVKGIANYHGEPYPATTDASVSTMCDS
jgi:hypothetical protein